jgi:hypothetical protein
MFMNKRIFYSEYFYEKGSKDTSVLERNANEYPYSSLASFLLLYHYKKTSNPAFEKFAKKTALLFNNPYWLQFQLFDKSAPISHANEVTNNDNNVFISTSSAENAFEETTSKAEGDFNGDFIPVENQIATIDNGEVSLETSSGENVIEESVDDFRQEPFNDEVVNEENAITTTDNGETSSEYSSTDNVIIKTEEVGKELLFAETSDQESNKENTETVNDSFDGENLQQIPENEANLEEPVLSNSFQKNEFVENENRVNQTPSPEDRLIEIAASEKAEIEKENTINENEPIAFEPLHTVDYFASQGIKITEELLTKDKLGSQMKSFTAWLKGMKKLHPGKLEEQSLATEKLIQASANESNFNTEILTEAMAEVLIKQDKKDKAIEMFSKLSLINPSKSAYFAARIESIKSS